MAVTLDKPGPYAPAPAVMGVVERYRDKGLPLPITQEVIERAGVSESLVPRTYQALQTLDLIDATGQPTPMLEAIKVAPAAEYNARLTEWLSNAYADILQYVDPATATEEDLHDQFRRYNPAGQRARMVTLFMGLFRAAGIAPEKASAPAAPRKRLVIVKRPKPDGTAKKTDQAPAPSGADSAGSVGGAGHHNAATKLHGDFRGALLAKFPDFDPSWSDDLKKAWFADFDLFMKMVTPS